MHCTQAVYYIVGCWMVGIVGIHTTAPLNCYKCFYTLVVHKANMTNNTKTITILTLLNHCYSRFAHNLLTSVVVCPWSNVPVLILWNHVHKQFQFLSQYFPIFTHIFTYSCICGSKMRKSTYWLVIVFHKGHAFQMNEAGTVIGMSPMKLWHSGRGLLMWASSGTNSVINVVQIEPNHQRTEEPRRNYSGHLRLQGKGGGQSGACSHYDPELPLLWFNANHTALTHLQYRHSSLFQPAYW